MATSPPYRLGVPVSATLGSFRLFPPPLVTPRPPSGKSAAGSAGRSSGLNKTRPYSAPEETRAVSEGDETPAFTGIPCEKKGCRHLQFKDVCVSCRSGLGVVRWRSCIQLPFRWFIDMRPSVYGVAGDAADSRCPISATETHRRLFPLKFNIFTIQISLINKTEVECADSQRTYVAPATIYFFVFRSHLYLIAKRFVCHVWCSLCDGQ